MIEIEENFGSKNNPGEDLLAVYWSACPEFAYLEMRDSDGSLQADRRLNRDDVLELVKTLSFIADRMPS